MPSPLRGIFTILATPFDAERQVDLDSLRRLIAFQLDLGVDGLTILGVLGEAAKLSLDERRLVLDTVMETVAGRAPIVVGASHPQLSTCIELSRAAFEAGAAAVMIHPPLMEQPTDAAVLAYYGAIAGAVSRPIVVQDLPTVSNVILSPDLLAALAEQNPYTRHLKLEDPPLMEKVSAILSRTDQITVFGALGGMFLLEELRRGAAGTMTGFAFIEVLVAVFAAFQAGDMAAAERIFDRYLPLIRYENQPKINLSLRKELLYRRGAIACPVLREPFAPLDPGTGDEIDWILARVGIGDPTRTLTF